MAWADGVLLGAPTRFGRPASELRAFLDGLGALWVTNRLFDKAGGVFTSTSTPHGGAETTLLSLYPVLAHLGFVIVPNGYGAPVNRIAATPYGSASVSNGPRLDPPTTDDLEVATSRAVAWFTSPPPWRRRDGHRSSVDSWPSLACRSCRR